MDQEPSMHVDMAVSIMNSIPFLLYSLSQNDIWVRYYLFFIFSVTVMALELDMIDILTYLFHGSFLNFKSVL